MRTAILLLTALVSAVLSVEQSSEDLDLFSAEPRAEHSSESPEDQDLFGAGAMVQSVEQSSESTESSEDQDLFSAEPRGEQSSESTEASKDQDSFSAESELLKFGALCSGNPGNRRRGCDGRGYGCGHYGASRAGGKRKHLGLDIVCADGATVYAPFDVVLGGRAVPYTKNNAINDGVNLGRQGLCFKLFYVKPDKYSGTLRKGQRLGKLLPMQSVYPGITSHIHVQMCDKTDPTKYF
ncbi:leukocyte cell-derived chemotaxin-2-like isoform X2 [Conger conger]|uniref:leukocyte cell-derived chemotaxin-2-like isoform X2 n=1 Tax=Conger conger TaxID=82655 RepID=UPI002A5A1241|nr:leukocyte cell-derived chemotaxin-2-like isoform X2 [Conger conger]